MGSERFGHHTEVCHTVLKEHRHGHINIHIQIDVIVFLQQSTSCMTEAIDDGTADGAKNWLCPIVHPLSSMLCDTQQAPHQPLSYPPLTGSQSLTCTRQKPGMRSADTEEVPVSSFTKEDE